jgi:hypothetical protein
MYCRIFQGLSYDVVTALVTVETSLEYVFAWLGFEGGERRRKIWEKGVQETIHCSLLL